MVPVSRVEHGRGRARDLPLAPDRADPAGVAGQDAPPADPPPGFGGILLGGIVAANIAEIDPDLVPDLLRLTTELEEGRRSPSPACGTGSRRTRSVSNPAATG